MPDENHTDNANAHEEGRKLAEEALEKYAAGDDKAGDALADRAVETDREGAEEVVRDLDEDAAATGHGKPAKSD